MLKSGVPGFTVIFPSIVSLPEGAVVVIFDFVVVVDWFPAASFTYTFTVWVEPAAKPVNLYVFPVPFTTALLSNWYQYSVTPTLSLAVTVTLISVLVTVVVTFDIVG